MSGEVASIILLLGSSLIAADDINKKGFPKEFKFGVASSSYQVEGAWNEDGKGENIWDHLVHYRPHLVKNNDTGDIACESYYNYKEDVALLKYLGVDFYRFSISWTRILPNGITNQINEEGVKYYQNLIKELQDSKIEPLVTLFHWDTPQYLEELGGWTNELIIGWFVDYARLCFKLFGQDVKKWMTFNEPDEICQGGYGEASKAPALELAGIADYLCTHNILRAHARVWHVYNDEFRGTQQGTVGIVIASTWAEPSSLNAADQEAAETWLQFTHGLYAHPLYFGDYPEVVKNNIKRRSLIQGFNKSRLPEFTETEKRYLKSTMDILGCNMYTSQMVKPVSSLDITTMGRAADSEVEIWQPDNWESTGSEWLKVTPWGIKKLLKWVDNTYNHPTIIITENGVSEIDSMLLEDNHRINFLQNYLSNVRNAIDEGVNVTGYTVWSLMDNFEWLAGYSQKFGLYHVDFNHPNRTRRAKKSATFYKNLISTRCLVDECEN